jgi:hypothetical protein
LIEEKRFTKTLFPNKKFASSLYPKYFDNLGNEGLRKKIA